LTIHRRDRTEPVKAPAPVHKAPTTKTAAGNASGIKKLDGGEATPWDLSQIWVESVAQEESTRKRWEETHAWMAEFDPRV
jgi:hypothetical protein